MESATAMIKLILALSIASASACAPAALPLDAKVAEIVVLTRETQSTYSLYTWNLITLADAPARGDWAAEFHRGSLHRVETSGDRLVADCATMTGFHLSLASGEITSGGSIAKAACGINANKRILTSQYLGPVRSRFGLAQRVWLTDKDNIRTYDVVGSGALVAATIADLDGTVRVNNFASGLLPVVPQGDIFSEASLQSSAVDDRYKKAPDQANQSVLD